MEEIQGFVLTGGASSRMGSDKAQLTLGGLKLYERAAIALSHVCVDPISLVGGNGAQLAANSRLDLRAIPDLNVDVVNIPRAAMVGLYSALANAETRWIAVLACDLPFVTGDLIAALAARRSDEFDAIVPLQQNVKPQPLCALYRREKCLSIAEEMLSAGDLQLQGFLSRVSTHFVAFDTFSGLVGSTSFFVNVNDQAEYSIALQMNFNKTE